MGPEKPPTAVVLRFPDWRWRKTVNDLLGLAKKSMQNSQRSWNLLSTSASRLLLNTPRPPLALILPSLPVPTLAVNLSREMILILGFLKVATAMHNQGDWW